MIFEMGAWVCCVKQYIAVFIFAIVFTHLYNIYMPILFLSVCFEGRSPSQFAVGGIEHTHKRNTILWYRSVSDYMSAPYHVPQHGISYIDYAI